MLDDFAREREIDARQQRAAEYFLDYDGLTDGLTDTQATPLLNWASYQASLAAAEPTRSDDDVDALLVRMRRAIRAAVGGAVPSDSSDDLIARAQKHLQASEEEGHGS